MPRRPPLQVSSVPMDPGTPSRCTIQLIRLLPAVPFIPVIYSLADSRSWCQVPMQKHMFDKDIVNRGSDLSWMKIQATLPHKPPGREAGKPRAQMWKKPPAVLFHT
ncbi:uncharacterized protein LOC144320823 [Canis aureus]